MDLKSVSNFFLWKQVFMFYRVQSMFQFSVAHSLLLTTSTTSAIGVNNVINVRFMLHNLGSGSLDDPMSAYIGCVLLLPLTTDLWTEQAPSSAVATCNLPRNHNTELFQRQKLVWESFIYLVFWIKARIAYGRLRTPKSWLPRRAQETLQR